MSDPIMDWERYARTGLPEAVYCPSKTDDQLLVIVEAAQSDGRNLLLTRMSEAQHAGLAANGSIALDYDPLSRTAILGGTPLEGAVRVGIVTAGLADLAAATECARTLAFSGKGSEIVADCGVAGLWRLLDRIESIRRFPVIVAVAGMEGALFSVLAGLVRAPIIALPTSVGDGVARDGHAALSSALASCAPGLSVVNIDNGFGAAQAAIRILGATAGNVG